MKIKNLKFEKNAKALLLATLLGFTSVTLSSCAYDDEYSLGNNETDNQTKKLDNDNRIFINNSNYFNKAIIFNYNSACIVEISGWCKYSDNDLILLVTKNGTSILCPVEDVKLVDDRDSLFNAFDIARAILGNDADITYLVETDDYSKGYQKTY